ncbi:MAG: sulfatase, partial [Planctomycetota bacterium]
EYKGDKLSWSVPSEMHYASHGSDLPQVSGTLPEDESGVPRTEMRAVEDEAYFDGRIAKKAIDGLSELAKKDQPFFLAVGFWKPHAPFNAPKKYWDLYERSGLEPPANSFPPKDVPPIAMHDSREILRGFRDRPMSKPTADEVITLRHGYYAATSFVDAQIGKVIDHLDALKLADNTIIVLWSDHGFHLGEHALWAKTSNFELDARVPLIIVSPKHEPAKTQALVELLDIYPTLVDLCGLPTPEHLEGKSLRPLLKDPQSSVKQAARTWHPRPAYPAAGKEPNVMGHSIRTKDFRYTEWRKFNSDEIVAQELYDHRADSLENRNVAGESRYRATLQELVQLLSR